MSDKPTRKADTLDRVLAQFERLERLADHYPVRNSDLSDWAVGQHVHHLGLAAASMMFSLVTGRHWQGEPIAPALKDRVLETGRIPRGKAVAPEGVSPDELPPTEEIRARLQKAIDRVRKGAAMPPDAFMAHPYLGKLSRDEALRFVEIHNAHHLRIIDRILDDDAES